MTSFRESMREAASDLFVGKRKIGRHTVFTLTPAGKAKTENYGNQPGDKILSALDEIRSGNTDEISQEAKISRGLVERYTPMLIKMGYIHVVRQDE